MRTTTYLHALIAAASAACAFKDTSPFMLFSTSELLFSSQRITTASQISAELSSVISQCPSDVYVIAQQPGVGFNDYSETISTPYLKEWMSGTSKGIRSSAYATKVLHTVEPVELARNITNKCGADSTSIDASSGYFDTVIDSSKKPQVVIIAFGAATSEDRKSEALRTNDLFLYNFINSLSSTSKYTVFYTTTPPTAEESKHIQKPVTYEMDSSMSPVHMDLKRDMSFQRRQNSGNITLVDGPLFERYQFLTPAIFMGLLTLFFLLSIGFVGVNALQSLQVSYAAFDKENGPAAQKKQQ